MSWEIVAVLANAALWVWSPGYAWRVMHERPAPVVSYVDEYRRMVGADDPARVERWERLVALREELRGVEESVKDGLADRWPQFAGAEAWGGLPRPIYGCVFRSFPARADEENRFAREWAIAALSDPRWSAVVDRIIAIGAEGSVAPPVDAERMDALWIGGLSEVRSLDEAVGDAIALAAIAGEVAEVERLIGAHRVLLGAARSTRSAQGMSTEIIRVGLFAATATQTAQRLVPDEETIDALLIGIEEPTIDPTREIRLRSRDMIQRCWTAGPGGSARLVISSFWEQHRVLSWLTDVGYLVFAPPVTEIGSPLDNVFGLVYPSRAWMEQSAESRLDLYESLLEAPARGSSKHDLLDEWVRACPPHTRFFHWMAPADGHVLDLRDLCVSMARGARLALAVRRFEATRGGLPRSLEEAVGAVPDGLVVDKTLIDPFARDGRFRYRVVETGRGPRPLLYSVGNNGVDDGGVAHPEPNRRTVLERDEGFDWVILDPGRLGDDDGE